MALHHLKQQFQQSAETLQSFDPADFVPVIDNPLFTLQPGTTYIYESPEGAEEAVVGTFTVTRKTIDILGVTCVVVEHTETVDGVLVEKTKDYFAQDEDGNVWYFGEDVKNFEDGKFVDTDGTWRAGVDGATPGFIMLANPQVGDAYAQEDAPGVAEDQAEVVSTNGLNPPADVPYGFFDQGLDTLESTPLEPDVFEHKIYVPGVGLVAVTEAVANPDGSFGIGDVVEQLVKVRFDGTSGHDTITGYVGADELNGRTGNDHLNGLAGSDTVNGGCGDDTLHGGADTDADFLYGGKGNDLVRVGGADRGFGGSGKDILQLFDNEGFDQIDGGGQPCRNLGKTGGDVLDFAGDLDLTAAGLSERISGIETLAMTLGQDSGSLRLSAEDVLDIGDGVFNPNLNGPDALACGDAIRIDGDGGDQLALTGGNWSEIEPKNAPDGYQLFGCEIATGNAYVLVQEEITVSLS
jgi:Ca2+-binding RTX toxin-like protein